MICSIKRSLTKPLRSTRSLIKADPRDKVNAAKCHMRMSWAYESNRQRSVQAMIYHRNEAYALHEPIALFEEIKCMGAWQKAVFFCFPCVLFSYMLSVCPFLFSYRYFIGVGLLGGLLTKIIIFQRCERKEKHNDERELLKKKQEERNEAKRKSELKQRRLNEKKQKLNEKKEDAKRKNELDDMEKREEQEDRERTEIEKIFKREQELKEKFLTEIKSSPRPDAVCRWEKCKQVQSAADIIPSQNIYFSDPDFKGYYKVCCRTNCQVNYHKSCWMSVKGENGEKLKLAKCPTEKDFLGQPCFTPDCGDKIVKIEIMEGSREIRTIKDDKMNEQLQADERKRREDAQIKRKRKKEEEGFKLYENRQIKKKSEKSKKNSPVSLTPVSLNTISSTSSVSFARDVSRVPQFPTPPLRYKGNLPPFPGKPEAGFSVPTPPVLPKIYSRPGITLQDFFTPPASLSTFSPTSFSVQSSPVPQLKVTQFGIDVPTHKKASQAVSSANYPNTDATSTGATAVFLASSRPTSTGAIPKSEQPGAKTGDKYDSLVAQLQINHPSISQKQARWYVREVRQSNKGKLSGMKRKDIFNKVASFVQRDTGSVDGARFIPKDKSFLDGEFPCLGKSFRRF